MKKILKIAKEVRKKCLAFAMSKDSYGRDYHKNKDLECMCATASFALAAALKEKKVKCKVIQGKWGSCDHCWVETDTHILDVTGTQFGLKRVMYIPKSHSMYYNAAKVVRSAYDLRSWDNQAPSHHLTRKIMQQKV